MLKEKYLPVMVPSALLVVFLEGIIIWLGSVNSHLASTSFLARVLFVGMAALRPILAWVGTGQLLIFIEKTVAGAHTLPGEPEEEP